MKQKDSPQKDFFLISVDSFLGEAAELSANKSLLMR